MISRTGSCRGAEPLRLCESPASAAAVFTVALGLPAWAATAGLALQPGRLEIEVKPGTQKTVSFEIESPPSDEAVRGRLLLSLTDWDLAEDGSLTFQDPGSQKMSAAPGLRSVPLP